MEAPTPSFVMYSLPLIHYLSNIPIMWIIWNDAISQN